MNGVGLFLAGVGVTLVVTTALALLVWGAILDGRDEAERRRALVRQQELVRRGGGPDSNVHPFTDRVPPHAA